MTQRQLFLNNLAQTSPFPLALEITKSEGSRVWDPEGKQYIDLIAGISVCNTGHRNPEVIRAIKAQLDAHLHLLVYGELIQTPQTAYADALLKHLPDHLNNIYFTNSGTEATEGAMKLAKRFTGRSEVVAFKNGYHGSTQGALSIIGDEYWRNAYRPLLPGILHLIYDSFEDLGQITESTSCVFAETVQAEAGVNVPSNEWMQALRNKCNETGALLVLDEIQCGFGRNGTLWAFEQYGISPDIVLLGKALGGGMPLGAFIADREIMQSFVSNPVLGHITTFGGHPVCCAAGLAAFKVLLKENIIGDVFRKEALFRQQLKHQLIKVVRSRGLMMAVEFESVAMNQRIIKECIENGLITDWFLFAPSCMRISPPLNITDEEIKEACSIIISVLNKLGRAD